MSYSVHAFLATDDGLTTEPILSFGVYQHPTQQSTAEQAFRQMAKLIRTYIGETAPSEYPHGEQLRRLAASKGGIGMMVKCHLGAGHYRVIATAAAELDVDGDVVIQNVEIKDYED